MRSSPTRICLSFHLVLAACLCVLTTAHLAFPQSRSSEYSQLQRRLALGWNTWDTHSMSTHVLLPEALAIHLAFKHNTTLFGDEILARTSVGQGAVFPGAHAWDGGYTELRVSWRGHDWSVESAHDGRDLVLLVTPLDTAGKFA